MPCPTPPPPISQRIDVTSHTTRAWRATCGYAGTRHAARTWFFDVRYIHALRRQISEVQAVTVRVRLTEARFCADDRALRAMARGAAATKARQRVVGMAGAAAAGGGDLAHLARRGSGASACGEPSPPRPLALPPPDATSSFPMSGLSSDGLSVDCCEVSSGSNVTMNPSSWARDSATTADIGEK